jgi:hypothetical protein
MIRTVTWTLPFHFLAMPAAELTRPAFLLPAEPKFLA